LNFEVDPSRQSKVDEDEEPLKSPHETVRSLPKDQSPLDVQTVQPTLSVQDKVVVRRDEDAGNPNTTDPELKFVWDKITPGDGNCFYHAIRQQLQRPSIRSFVDPSFRDLTHMQLRKAAVDFFLEGNETDYPGRDAFVDLVLMQLEYFVDDVRKGETLQQVCLRQYEDGIFVFHPFIQAMASVLKCGIKLYTRDDKAPRDLHKF